MRRAVGPWVRRLAVAAVVCLPGGCLLFPGQTPPLNVGNDIQAEFVVSEAAHPSALAFAEDGRVFYTEKNTGRIRVILDGALLPDPFATVPVNFAGDRGALGIALHPDFAANGRVYVFYTRSDTGFPTGDPRAVVDHRVVYSEASGNVASGGEVFVASLPVGAGPERVGGRIAFAPDGKLLVALGDLGDPGSVMASISLLGKILRYNDDGTIPDDNPVAESPVFARGLRDPRGLAFDPVSGVAFAPDRNDVEGEEINRLLAGRNYGWPSVAGKAESPGQLQYAAQNPDYMDPILDTSHQFPGLTGGAFNPSTRYGPSLEGHFFYGESDARRVQRLELNTDRTALAKITTFAEQFPARITDVAFTPAGTLYVACEDAIFRIVPVR